MFFLQRYSHREQESRMRIMNMAILALWVAWMAYWIIAARRTKATRWREPAGRELTHGALAIAAVILLAVPLTWPSGLAIRFVPAADAGVTLLGLVMTAAGIGFAVAARLSLADNWSSAVEVKENHTLIRGGPYRYVRHPIYSGLLLAFLGTAIAIGRWRALLAVAFLLLAFLLKARREETEMRRTFPDYQRYVQDTAALIPWLL
jgi:protein-S-isoprenylcysteine O-methyltransferase Ste14